MPAAKPTSASARGRPFTLVFWGAAVQRSRGRAPAFWQPSQPQPRRRAAQRPCAVDPIVPCAGLTGSRLRDNADPVTDSRRRCVGADSVKPLRRTPQCEQNRRADQPRVPASHGAATRWLQVTCFVFVRRRAIHHRRKTASFVSTCNPDCCRSHRQAGTSLCSRPRPTREGVACWCLCSSQSPT